jgi:plasmid stability protein
MAKKPTAKRTGRDSDQFIVRFPEGMREALADLAARNGRSMNAEIIHALALHFAGEGMTTDERLKSLLRARLGSALTEIIHELMVEHVKKGIE